jgi:anti-sigma factor RsiW
VKCTSSWELIESSLDGELDANRRAELRAHLYACADCDALHEHLQELRDDIRRLAPRYTAPARLQQRVLTDLRESSRRNSPSYAQTWKMLAIAALVLLGVSLGR